MAKTATEPTARVTVTLPDGRKWDTSRPTATFPRPEAAVQVLVVHGATAEGLTDDELRAAAPEAFARLEAVRGSAEPDVYLAQYPKRAACYQHIAALLEEVPA